MVALGQPDCRSGDRLAVFVSHLAGEHTTLIEDEFERRRREIRCDHGLSLAPRLAGGFGFDGKLALAQVRQFESAVGTGRCGEAFVGCAIRDNATGPWTAQAQNGEL